MFKRLIWHFRSRSLIILLNIIAFLLILFCLGLRGVKGSIFENVLNCRQPNVWFSHILHIDKSALQLHMGLYKFNLNVEF